MRRAAAPVAVVTVDAGDLKYALTVGSLVSLSLEPRAGRHLIGHASHRTRRSGARGGSRSASSPATRRRSRSTSRAACRRSRSGRGSSSTSPGSPEPACEGAVSWLECCVVAEHEAGDHTIFVG